MNGEISHRDQNCFYLQGCKHVNFCGKVEHFHMGVNGDWLTFIASLKWPFEELQFLALLHWLHFSTSVIAACIYSTIPHTYISWFLIFKFLLTYSAKHQPILSSLQTPSSVRPNFKFNQSAFCFTASYQIATGGNRSARCLKCRIN